MGKKNTWNNKVKYGTNNSKHVFSENGASLLYLPPCLVMNQQEGRHPHQRGLIAVLRKCHYVTHMCFIFVVVC